MEQTIKELQKLQITIAKNLLIEYNLKRRLQHSVFFKEIANLKLYRDKITTKVDLYLNKTERKYYNKKNKQIINEMDYIIDDINKIIDD